MSIAVINTLAGALDILDLDNTEILMLEACDEPEEYYMMLGHLLTERGYDVHGPGIAFMVGDSFPVNYVDRDTSITL